MSSIWSKLRFKTLFERKRIVDYVFLAMLAAYGLFIIRNMFESGYFYNYDLNQHLVESVYVATVLLPNYHQLIGWNPYYYLGWPQGQFNPPASYLIYSILYYLLSWALSPLVIFKVMVAAFFLMQGFAIYLAAKGFGLSRLSAFLGGFITIGTAGGFETGGPLSTLYYGMYEYALAIALIPLALAIYHLSFVKKSRSYLLMASILAAFDFLLHTLAGIFLLLALGVYTIAELFRMGVFETNRLKKLPRLIWKFSGLGLIVAGICSFWVIPAYMNRGYYSYQASLVTELGNYATTYNDLHAGYIFGEQSIPLISNIFHPGNPVLSEMLWSSTQKVISSSPTMFYQLLLILAIVGSVFSLIKSKSRFPILVILFLIGIYVYISLGPNYYHMLWNDPTFRLIDLRPGRAAAVARVFLALLAGSAIGEGYSLAIKGIKKLNRSKIGVIVKVGAIVVIVFLGITLLVNSYSLMSQLPLGSTTNNLSAGNDIQQVFSWIKQNVPNSTRVAFQEYPQDGIPQHLFAITPLETGDQEIGSNYAFWWPGADSSNSVNSILNNAYYYSSNELYSTFAGLNSEYVVVWSADAYYGLSQSTQFALEKKIGPFYIYKLSDFTPSYVSIQGQTVSSLSSAKVSSFQPEKIVISLSNVTAGETLLVRMAYYSNWNAYSSEGNQLPVKLEEVSLPLLSANYTDITLQNGGTYNVTLTYYTTAYDSLGNGISIISLITLFISFIFVALESRTRYPIAEYMALAVRKTSEIVRASNFATNIWQKSRQQRILDTAEGHSGNQRESAEKE